MLVAVLCAASALSAAGAAAAPGEGPREVFDESFTTKHPDSPTGISLANRYHAAGDETGTPPPLKRMVIHPPRGMRFDTGVPESCTATDAELQLRGPAACPAGSLLGDGTTEGLILAPFGHSFVFDHFTHSIYVLNNTDEQIVLVESEGFTVVRGRFMPDGSVEWTPTTCFPAVPGTDCPDDYVIQLANSNVIPPYTRTAGGQVRSYATTPPKCPKRRHWKTKVEFWWADGSADSVVTTQPCKRH